MIRHSVPMRQLMNLIDRTASANRPRSLPAKPEPAKRSPLGRFRTGRLEKGYSSQSTAPRSPKAVSLLPSKTLERTV
jgi:hypothetical protein